MKRSLLALGLIFALAACKTAAPTTDWAAECANRFPPRTDTFRVTTERIKFDTLFAPPSKVPFSVKTICPPSDTVRVVESVQLVDCPPAQTITKTRVLHDSITVYVANMAAENSLIRQLNTAKGQLEAANRFNRSLISDIAARKRQMCRVSWLSIAEALLLVFFGFLTLKKYKNG